MGSMGSMAKRRSCRNPASCMFRAAALIVLMLDLFTKMLAERYRPSGSGFFSINYTTNTGAAFGIFQQRTAFLIAASIIVLISIIYILFYRIKNPSSGMVIFSALMFGGAMGNLIDRVFRGHVIDFINFSFWPAFNVADIAITLGVIGLIYYVYKK